MAKRYPNILGIIEEVIEGYTVTIYLRRQRRPRSMGRRKWSADTVDEAYGGEGTIGWGCKIRGEALHSEIK
jgi:hypothetical protein